MRAIGALLVFSAAAMAFVAPAVASAEDHAVAYADLNGDQRIDRVLLTSNGPSHQTVTAMVSGYTYTLGLPLDSSDGVQPLRTADLRNNGVQQLVVTEAVGANTRWFTVWGLNAKGMWTSVQTLDEQVLRLSEGGGANAVSGYGCVLVGDNDS